MGRFHEYVSVLNTDTSATNVEFYSLSNSFCFIMLCYIEQKIYMFCGGLQFQDLNAQKFGPAGDYRPLKVGTLKVNYMFQNPCLL